MARREAAATARWGERFRRLRGPIWRSAAVHSRVGDRRSWRGKAGGGTLESRGPVRPQRSQGTADSRQHRSHRHLAGRRLRCRRQEHSRPDLCPKSWMAVEARVPTLCRWPRSIELAANLDWQVDAVGSALILAGIDPLPTITPVLCFIDGDWPFIDRPDEFDGVRIESERSIGRLVTRKAELDASRIEEIARTIAGALPPKVASSGHDDWKARRSGFRRPIDRLRGGYRRAGRRSLRPGILNRDDTDDILILVVLVHDDHPAPGTQQVSVTGPAATEGRAEQWEVCERSDRSPQIDRSS